MINAFRVIVLKLTRIETEMSLEISYKWKAPILFPSIAVLEKIDSQEKPWRYARISALIFTDAEYKNIPYKQMHEANTAVSRISLSHIYSKEFPLYIQLRTRNTDIYTRMHARFVSFRSTLSARGSIICPFAEENVARSYRRHDWKTDLDPKNRVKIQECSILQPDVD